MAFVILCDRCGAIIRPGKSSYTSVSCTMNGKMDAFVICERCDDELKQWITGNEVLKSFSATTENRKENDYGIT